MKCALHGGGISVGKGSCSSRGGGPPEMGWRCSVSFCRDKQGDSEVTWDSRAADRVAWENPTADDHSLLLRHSEDTAAHPQVSEGDWKASALSWNFQLTVSAGTIKCLELDT